MTPHRRQVLTALGTTGVAALAGCSSLGGNESPTETAPPLSEHTTKLAAADGGFDDDFGESVAMAADGTTTLVGAPEDENPNGPDSGATYLFERAGNSWTQQLKLTPANGDSQDEFGVSVAMAADGTTALIGAHEDEDPNGYDAGAAYVFEQAGGTWTQQAKLAAADGDSKDRFGDAVAMAADGTTALVGASLNEDPNGKRAGAAYVFERAGGTWTQQANLAPTDGDPGDRFGASVAMAADGTTALVGAQEDESPNGETGGSAYVFERAGDSWTQQAKLAPADGDSEDHFGSSVAMAGDRTTTLVGAWHDEDPNGKRAGAAYVFERSGDSWTQQAKLTLADGDALDRFGRSVAVGAAGSTALVGACGDEEPNGTAAGAAYVFERAGGSWTQQAKLAPADGDAGDGFGASVALGADGSTALVGTPDDDDPNGEGAGAAYVFERSGGSWYQ